MRVIGNPNFKNSQIKMLVENVIVNTESIDLREYVAKLTFFRQTSVLDIGESLREIKGQLAPDVNYFSLDLLTDSKPSFQADICDENLAKEFSQSFDIVCCFSLLEHVYNPFSASRNLLDLCKNGGIVIGSVPFLFPRHSPEDLSYQDFFRFTRDSLGILFPTASKVEVWPDRGRLATALICLSSSYKYLLEKRFTKFTKLLSGVMRSGKHQLQTSGFQFRITK